MRQRPWRGLKRVKPAGFGFEWLHLGKSDCASVRPPTIRFNVSLLLENRQLVWPKTIQLLTKPALIDKLLLGTFFSIGLISNVEIGDFLGRDRVARQNV